MHIHSEDCGFCDVESLDHFDSLDVNLLTLKSQQQFSHKQQALAYASEEFARSKTLVSYIDFYVENGELMLAEFTPEGSRDLKSFGKLPEPVDVDKIKIVKNFMQSTDLPVTIVFTKADQSERTLVHVRTTDGLKPLEEGQSQRLSVTNRKKNNPGLISVFDSELHAQGTPASQCWRSVKVDSIKTLQTGGVTLSLS